MSKPKVFEHAFRLAPDDIIRMGHVKNCAQDAALTHELAQAPREHVDALVWVVRRQQGHRGGPGRSTRTDARFPARGKHTMP